MQSGFANTLEEFVMQFLAPALGVVTSELLAIGPLIAILNCRKTKQLGDLNPLPFPLLFGNSVGMIIYSVLIRNPFVFAGNIGAVLLSSFYVLTVYDLTESKSVRRRLDVMISFLSSMWLIAGFVVIIEEDQLSRIRTVGVLGNIVVFFLFASPLTTCAEVFRTQNASSINRPFAYCQVINCIVWLCYGLVLADPFIILPNFLGLWLGVAQVALICRFPPPADAPPNDGDRFLEAAAAAAAVGSGHLDHAMRSIFGGGGSGPQAGSGNLWRGGPGDWNGGPGPSPAAGAGGGYIPPPLPLDARGDAA